MVGRSYIGAPIIRARIRSPTLAMRCDRSEPATRRSGRPTRAGSTSVAPLDRHDRGADDPGVVAQAARARPGQRTVRRGMNRSAFLLTPPPRIIRFGHMSSSIRCEVLVEVLAPGLPRQAATDAGRRRRSALGGSTADLHLAELGVRDEDPVDEHARTDAGPEGQEDDHARLLPPDPKPHLGDPRRVGVVDDADRSTGRLAQPLDDREVDPARIDVGGRLERVVQGHPGQPDPDRRGGSQAARLCQTPDEPADRGDDGIGRRRDRASPRAAARR